MPQLTTVLTAQDLSRPPTIPRQDLTAYRDILAQVRGQAGVGGEVHLREGEQARTEKRRFSVAAKQLGVPLKWRKAGVGTLRFVLAEPGAPFPGSRPRRPKPPAPTPIPQATRRRRTAG
jgi:hypothetical protein